MPILQYRGPDKNTVVRDPFDILPPILLKKGESVTVEEPRMVALLAELGCEEVRDEPRSPKKADGKS